MSEREGFYIKGVGCWCPGEMTLRQARLSGHTKKCSQARVAWRANMQHLSEIDRQRREDAEVGRQIREEAAAVVSVPLPEEAERNA